MEVKPRVERKEGGRRRKKGRDREKRREKAVEWFL